MLDQLEPKDVWCYFEDICRIPHGSGNQRQIGDYLTDFAKKHNLEYHRDSAGNIIIIKEASVGYEDVPALILQGHSDMVCEKTAETKIDFLYDGLTLETDGDFVTASGTTLGGDDGIAVAYSLAFLADETLKHPRLEAVITADEEIGMLGCAVIDVSMLKSKKLINLDSEAEGVFLAGCAGGLTFVGKVPVRRESCEGTIFKMDFSGFKGGHSGNEINVGRANSNIAAARILFEASNRTVLHIISMEGGNKENAIPRQTSASVLIPAGTEDAFLTAVKEEEAILRNEYANTDGNFTIAAEKSGTGEAQVLTAESQVKFFNILMNIPNGVQTMSSEIKGLVETSQSMGVLRMSDTDIEIRINVRSSRNSAKYYLSDRTAHFIKEMGGTSDISAVYSGWTFQKESPLRETFIASYEKLFGKTPTVEAIHAGVECGILQDKLGGADCISLGPQMYGIHTPDEKLSIASVERTYRLVREVIEKKA